MRIRLAVYDGRRLRWSFDTDMPAVPRVGERVLLDPDVKPLPDSVFGEPLYGDCVVQNVAYAYAGHLEYWRPGVKLSYLEV